MYKSVHDLQCFVKIRKSKVNIEGVVRLFFAAAFESEVRVVLYT
jgi:hypothetical protein